MEEENKNKKNKRQFIGFLILIGLLLILAVISRFRGKGKNTLDTEENTEIMTTEQPIKEDRDGCVSAEEVAKEYYQSLEEYIDGSNERINRITAYYPERFDNDTIKNELYDGLDAIKENNISFDVENAVFIAADIENSRIVMTDTYYIYSDFEDIKIVISSVPILIRSTNTDAVSTTEYTDNLLTVKFKGSWYVIPGSHYYFK